MIAGIAMQTILLLLVLYKTNWNKEVGETKCFSFSFLFLGVVGKEGRSEQF